MPNVAVAFQLMGAYLTILILFLAWVASIVILVICSPRGASKIGKFYYVIAVLSALTGWIGFGMTVAQVITPLTVFGILAQLLCAVATVGYLVTR